MLKVKRIGLWFAILGIAMTTQACWEDDQDRLTLLGEGGCRTPEGSAGDPISIPKLSSDECKARCFAGDKPCVAVEYNANTSLCEIHSEPITKFEKVAGVACYVTR